MPTAKVRASTILAEFHKAELELIGKAVVLSDGKAGTVEHLWLDELHGLRISVRGHEGRWPVSTIKLAQTDVEGGSTGSYDPAPPAWNRTKTRNPKTAPVRTSGTEAALRANDPPEINESPNRRVRP